MPRDNDRESVLWLHDQWITANTGLDVARMARVFPGGESYLMFNCNGHTYNGLAEKVTLWEYLRTVMEYEILEDEVLRLDLSGDIAYLAAEGRSTLRLRGEVGGYRWRATEVYRRDDGEGNPEWRMWHYHCSHRAPQEEQRPGFTDAAGG